ncbi:MAG: hypothetical protein JEZ14_19205 [Marinilabiliaceae bacterium]|nr:hypothetical protein [Marinilabiliaceae bacterium]
MRNFITLGILILTIALGNAQELVINTSFELEENFPGGNIDQRYNFTGVVTDLLDNQWISSSNLQSWRFPDNSKYDRSPETVNHSIWVKNGSFLECAPTGTIGAGTLEFWSIAVSNYGNPFTINVEYSANGGEWVSAFSQEYFAQPGDWEKISVTILQLGNVKIRISSTGIDANDKGWLIEDLSLTGFDSTTPMSYISSNFMHDA